MQESNLGTINIANLDNTIYVSHPEIKRAIGQIGNDISDAYTNISSVDVTIPVVNDTLKTTFNNFKTFDTALCEYNKLVNDLNIIRLEIVKKRSELDSSFKEINEPEDLLNDITSFAELFGIRSIAMISGINYADENIQKYNDGKITYEQFGKSLNEFKDWIDGNNLIIAGHSIINNTINEIFSNNKLLGSGLAFLINTNANKYRSNVGKINNAVSSLYSQLSEKLDLLDLASKPNVWVNTTVGTAIYATVDFFVKLYEDEGNLLPEDIEKIGKYTIIDSTAVFASSAIVYASSTVGTWVGEMVGGAIGSLGGPIGTAAGYLLGALVIYPIGSWLSQVLVGDGIVYEYELNGKSYEIPLNGIGKNGDYDALFYGYEESLRQDRLNDKETMYSNLDYFLATNLTKDNNQNLVYLTNGEIDDYSYELFKEMLDSVYLECAKNDFYCGAKNAYENLRYQMMITDEKKAAKIDQCLNYLVNNFDFDLQEYVDCMEEYRME